MAAGAAALLVEMSEGSRRAKDARTAAARGGGAVTGGGGGRGDSQAPAPVDSSEQMSTDVVSNGAVSDWVSRASRPNTTTT